MLKEKIQGTVKSAKQNIKTILLDLTVGAISIVFVFYRSLILEQNHLNPLELLLSALVGIVVGVMIKMAIGEKGFIKGHNAEVYTNELKRYGTKADAALPYIDKQDEFIERERKSRLAKKRKIRLAQYRMRYETFFDEDGNFIEHDNIISPRAKKRAKKQGIELPADVIVLDFAQRTALKKSIKLKIYIDDLFNEYESSQEDDETKDKTEKDKRNANLKRNIVFATIIAMLGVYFLPHWYWDIGFIIWALLQVMIWITFGVVQLYGNYSFVTGYKVSRLKSKEELLSKFILDSQGREELIKVQKKTAEAIAQPPMEQPKKTEEVVVEMTEDEAKAQGLIK